MLTINKKLGAMTLGLLIMFAAVVPANAQRWRDRDRLSTGKKAAIIGGGAVAGAVLGGLLGGKKGAVVGGLLGGAGGGGYVYYKNRQEDNRYGRYYGYRDYRGYRDNGRFGRFYRNRR
jgi:osmotically inducible lipoprotein OsmB